MEKEVALDGTLNLSAHPDATARFKDVIESINLCVNVTPGYRIKRPGFIPVFHIQELEDSAGVRAYFRFYKNSGVVYDIIIHDLTTGVNELVWYKKDLSGEWSNGKITPFFPVINQEITGLAVGDRLLLTDGVSATMFFKDEDNYGVLEVTKPRIAPSGSVVEWEEKECESPPCSGVIITPPGLIEYKVSYYFDDQPDKESNTSGASELVDGQYMFNYGIRKVRLDIPVSLNERTSGRWTYRRYKQFADDVFSGWQRWVIANNADEVHNDITVADGSGADLPLNTDKMPVARCLTEVNNRVYYGNVIVPQKEAGVGFAYSQMFHITQNEGKTFTNPIVPTTLQWNNPKADNYIEYDDFVANEGRDFKFMLNDPGVVTPLGFVKTDFNAEAQTVSFKIRFPQLADGVPETIMVFYGKKDMASLSDWRDLYRKELLYSDMVAFFDMDKFGGYSVIYNRASNSRESGLYGYLHDAEFVDGDGGFYGGINSQTKDEGKHVQLTQKDGDNGYIDFSQLGYTEAQEDQTVSFWFKLGDTLPGEDDNKLYSLFEYRHSTQGYPTVPIPVVRGLGLYLRHNTSGDVQIVFLTPEMSLNFKNIGDLWDGNWHQIRISWEKVNAAESKWHIALDGKLVEWSPGEFYITDSTYSTYIYNSDFHWYLGERWDEALLMVAESYIASTPRPYFVDTFIWYNRILEAAEIAKLYLRETYFAVGLNISSEQPTSLAGEREANTIYWSEEDIPEKVLEENKRPIGSSNAIIGLVEAKNNLVILKKDDLRWEIVTGAVEYWKLSDNLIGNVRNMGLITSKTLASVGGSVMGLSTVGMFLFDGNSFAYPGKKAYRDEEGNIRYRDTLDGYLKELSRDILEKALGVYYAKKNEYWLYVNGRLFVVDLSSFDWTEYRGIDPSYFEIWGNENGELLFADKDNHRIYKFGEGATDDDGSPIETSVRKRFDFRKPPYHSSQFIALYLGYNGGDGKVDMEVNIDGKNSEIYECIEANSRQNLRLGSNGKIIEVGVRETSKQPFEIGRLTFDYNPLRR